GLPPIRGTKSTSEASYLNNLYRQRAERAGIVYIDVWDGFVDEAGKFTTFGPDYEGQKRRLRSADGVFFTKYGARKLAHYVEREIRRYMSNRIVALPTSPVAPTPENGKPAERPLAGPVVPLTVTTSTTDELLGGSGAARVHSDAIASQVLVKGEPLSPQRGRADDYAWPPGSPPKVEPAAAPVTKAPAAVPAPAVAAVAPTKTAPPAATPSIAAPEPTAPADAAEASVEPKAGAGKTGGPKAVARPPQHPETREAAENARRRGRRAMCRVRTIRSAAAAFSACFARGGRPPPQPCTISITKAANRMTCTAPCRTLVRPEAKVTTLTASVSSRMTSLAPFNPK